MFDGNSWRSKRVTTAVLTFIMFGHAVRGGHPPVYSPRAAEDYGPKTDLESILRDPPIQQHERLSEALQIIHPIQSGPRCHYQAALNLLNDCKFLEKTPTTPADAKPNSETALEDLETIYAARLAVCELMSANAAIPQPCKVVAPSREACNKKRQGLASWFSHNDQPQGDRLCYPEPEPQKLKKCMNAIYVQPQAWMSYSNARQNAVVMCHASRDVIEKEKTLSHYKNMGEAVSLMASVLETYNAQIKMWLSEHDALVEKIRNSSEQVLQDMEEGLSTFDSIRNAFRSFAGMMYSASESYGEEISKSLAKSKSDLEEHRREMQDSYKDIAETSLQHASGQRAQLQLNHDAAVAALQTYHNAALETLQYTHQAAILKVEEVANSIDGLQEKVEFSSSNLEIINQGLENVNRTVQRLDAATEKLPEVLQAFTAFGSIVTSPQLLVAAILCIVGVWKANGKIAGYIMVAAGFSYALSLLNFMAYARAFRHFSNACMGIVAENRTPIALVFFGIAAVCFLAFLLHVLIRTAYLCEVADEHGQFILPSIESRYSVDPKTILPSIESPSPTMTADAPPPRSRRRRYGLLRALYLQS